MKPSEQGDKTEAVVLSFLAQAGYTVLVPFGVARYDLAIDPRDGSGIKTVQCKTGRIDRGCILFRTHSVDRQTGARKHYRGEVDYFGVWCSARPGSAYLVPVGETPETMGYLRIDPPRSNQLKNIKWADQYEIKGL
jgi:PD-(D/E)XK endonuclease